MVSNETMKAVSLVVFTFQNAAFVLLMRQSKVTGTQYNSSVAVLVTEMLKLPLAYLLLCYELSSARAAVISLWNNIVLSAPSAAPPAARRLDGRPARAPRALSRFGAARRSHPSPPLLPQRRTTR